MELEEVVLKLANNVEEMKESQIRMEADINEHIRRTNLLEDKIDEELTPVYKAYIGIKWSIGLILTVSSLYLALSRLGVL